MSLFDYLLGKKSIRSRPQSRTRQIWFDHLERRELLAAFPFQPPSLPKIGPEVTSVVPLSTVTDFTTTEITPLETPPPTDPAPLPADPVVTDPTTTDPTTTDPTTTDPTTTDPTTTDPTATDPAPTDPPPTDPQPTDTGGTFTTFDGGGGSDPSGGEAGSDSGDGGTGSESGGDGGGSDTGDGGTPTDGGGAQASPPVIYDFDWTMDANLYTFSGHVLDNGDPSQLTIYFGGLISGAFDSVNSDGSFSFTIELEDPMGYVTAMALDGEGLWSNEVASLV